MKNRVFALLCALALVMSLTACAVQTAPKTPDPGAARVFTDDCGRSVTLPEKLTAIVASGPVSQLVLFAIAPELLVGLAAEWGAGAEEYIPAEYRALPYFGQLYGSANLNVEELAAAAPQVVIDVGQAKASLASDMDALEAQTCIPSIHLEASLATMPEVFRTLGELLDREERGEELAAFCETVYDQTLSILSRVGEQKVRALYLLGEGGTNVLAKGSYHAELIDLLTDNVAVVSSPVSKGSGNAVTAEQLALWDPDVLLLAPGLTDAENAPWRELRAAKEGRYLAVPGEPVNWLSAPPSVQRYLGLIWLTAALYPEYCEYDVQEEVTAYYALFYGCRLTDAQYAALTARSFFD